MPAALDKSSTYRVVLECDRDKPEGEQPWFEFRRLNGREFRGAIDLSRGFADGIGPEEAMDELYRPHVKPLGRKIGDHQPWSAREYAGQEEFLEVSSG